MRKQDRPTTRVALVGCGQIADAHLRQIAHVPQAEVVAVCDVHEDLARQAAERFGVAERFVSFDAMLEKTHPDVVHITTPVHTHAPLAIQAMESGTHVYVEKPFTVDASEAESVVEAARATGRSVCLGHDQLFDPIWLECRSRCAAGQIGEVRHVESILGYPIDGPFGALVAANENHWVRRLPGGLFQNTISHPLYRITDFLTDEEPHVWATWFEHDRQFPFPTELRVHLRGERVTGSLLFTSDCKPRHRLTRVYGTRGTLEVDLNAQVIRRERDAVLPGAFGKLEIPWRQFRESVANLSANLLKFSRSDIHYFAGMRHLFDSFYTAIREGDDCPVPYEEALRVTRLMDEIFTCCRNGDASQSLSKRQDPIKQVEQVEALLSLERDAALS